MPRLICLPRGRARQEGTREGRGAIGGDLSDETFEIAPTGDRPETCRLWREMLCQQPPGQPIVARRRQPRAEAAQIADGRLHLCLRAPRCHARWNTAAAPSTAGPACLSRLPLCSPAIDRRAAPVAATTCARRARSTSQSGRASHGSAWDRSNVASPTISRRSCTPKRTPAGNAVRGLPSSTTFSGPFPIPPQTSATTSPASVTRSHTRSKLASTLPVTPGRRMAAARKLMEQAEVSKSANRQISEWRIANQQMDDHVSRITRHASRSPPTSPLARAKCRPPRPTPPAPPHWRPSRASAGSCRSPLLSRPC